MAPLLGMAFDAPPTTGVYVGVWAVWSYPASVLIAWALKRKKPVMVLFPCVNAAAFLAACFIDKGFW
jgi:hypothetical protein